MKLYLGMTVFFATVHIAWNAPEARQTAHHFDGTTAHRVHLSYLLFLPRHYEAERESRWPLILYLHGGSLRGDDVELVRKLGLPHMLDDKPDFPCVVVSPQCSAGEIWTDVDAIEALLNHLQEDYRIDPQRVYITGHSMGGRGALYFAYRLPGRFAAVLALSPYSPITAWAGPLAKIPLWFFHGTADATAPIAETKELVQALEAGGGHPRFSRLEGRDHFILDVYDQPDIYQWLLQQKRMNGVTQ